MRRGLKFYVRAYRLWSPTWMLGAIMQELGAHPMARTSRMIEFIVRALAQQQRPLFIDEADYLTDDRRLLDTLRDLHDMATTPLILIGMADFKKRVLHKEQLAGRVSQWVEFQPATLDDAKLLARTVCEVEVADDLLEALHKSAGGSMRGLTVGLARIESHAKRRGIKQIALPDWGDRSFMLSSPPAAPKRELSLAKG
jgi:DNA transposition AAA+ family ATPase